MRKTITVSSPVQKTGRVLQMAGIFDVSLQATSGQTWTVNLPIEERDWQIGLIVGASGTGKSTIAREIFGSAVVERYDWPADKSILDAFPGTLSIKDITLFLSSVGFSSPPSWVRPYHVLSTGEKFRVTVARALAEAGEALVVIDEFTSVVDRTVAQIGSAAVAKAVRRQRRRFVAVTCHYDVIEWLNPDWVFEAGTNEFQWRLLRQRPAIELEVRRVHTSAWQLFQPYHYLSADHHKAARCFVAFIDYRPVAFVSVLHFPHATRPGWREHRSVVLPDYQGVGIGNALSEYVAGLFVATGKPYRDTTGHPGHVYHRQRSPLWRTTKQAAINKAHTGRSRAGTKIGVRRMSAFDRLTWSFEFVGPPNSKDAKGFGVLS